MVREAQEMAYMDAWHRLQGFFVAPSLLLCTRLFSGQSVIPGPSGITTCFVVPSARVAVKGLIE